MKYTGSMEPPMFFTCEILLFKNLVTTPMSMLGNPPHIYCAIYCVHLQGAYNRWISSHSQLWKRLSLNLWNYSHNPAILHCCFSRLMSRWMRPKNPNKILYQSTSNRIHKLYFTRKNKFVPKSQIITETILKKQQYNEIYTLYTISKTVLHAVYKL